MPRVVTALRGDDKGRRALTRSRHPEALAKRAIASRLLPTCALWCRSRVNPRSVGDGPDRADILRGPRFARAPQDDGQRFPPSALSGASLNVSATKRKTTFGGNTGMPGSLTFGRIATKPRHL